MQVTRTPMNKNTTASTPNIKPKENKGSAWVTGASRQKVPSKWVKRKPQQKLRKTKAKQGDKITIKAAIEYLFNVKVTKVNTCQLPKKKKRVGKYIGWKSQYKKAIVTLADGDTINLFAEN